MRALVAGVGAILVALAGSVVPAAAGARHEPAIVSPKDGATVGNPVTVVVDLNGAEVPGHSAGTAPMPGMADMPAPAGQAHGGADDGARHGHAHLLIDSPLPKAGTMVPIDERHVHVIGESKTTLTLPPGRHTLQLILAGEDHMVPRDAPRSKKITIRVK